MTTSSALPLRGSGTDGQHDPNAPGAENKPRWGRYRPRDTHEEMITTAALQSAFIPGQELADNTRPPLPLVDPFRPRFGYRTRALGVGDMVDVDELYQPPYNDFSGTPAGYSGTARNAQSTGSW